MKPNQATNLIKRILKSWDYDLRDAERLEDLINAFMDANTCKEVNEIIMSNINFIDRMGLWKHANGAKRRINNLQSTKIKLTDIKYLN